MAHSSHRAGLLGRGEKRTKESERASDQVSFTDRLGMTIPQAVLAWVLVLLVGGAAGVIAMLLCHYMLTFGGHDSSDKHGISQVSATRIGGVAIVTYMALHLGYQYTAGIYKPSLAENSIMMTALAYFLLGIYEDLRGDLSARLRFGIMIAIAAATMAFSTHLVLLPVGISWLDVILRLPVSAVLLTAVCVAFIPNAFNTADGANGLVAGISLAVLTGLTAVAPAELLPFISAGAVACLVFLVFNLISGRFFLGDGGAYFLGAFCGLAVVVVSNTTSVSVWWLLAMIFYPVADLIWSMGRRYLAGDSPFKPDNQHFHNVLFAWLDSSKRSSQTANTTCGVGIAALFAGLPLALFMGGVLPVESGQWFGVVVAQCGIYALGWRALNKRLCLLPSSEEQFASGVEAKESAA